MVFWFVFYLSGVLPLFCDVNVMHLSKVGVHQYIPDSLLRSPTSSAVSVHLSW